MAKTTGKTQRKRPTKKPARKRPAGFVSAHRADVDAYIAGVVSGDIVVGRLVRAAVDRHLADLDREKAGWDYTFDEQSADRVITFIECLKHSTGEFEGRPFLLLPWQKFLLWVLFGWKVAATGMRRFREAFISMGRGNGKSPLAAAVLLYLLCADQPPEPRAEIKIAATERGAREDNSGSRIVFNECCRFIERNSALAAACQVREKAIVYERLNSTITPLGKESATKDGFNLHAFVADELHEWQKHHQGLWDKLNTAMGKRRQPLALMITTAGSDRSHLWRRQYNAACKVVRGVYDDPALFVFIAQIDEAEPETGLPGDDWQATNAAAQVWPKANPNLGICVKPDYLQRLTAKALHDADDRYNLLRYHLNVMVRSQQKIINLDQWKACDALPLPDLDRRACHGGLDLGWRDDLASFYLTFPLEGGRYAVRGWTWICEETPHRDLTREPWDGWIRSGRLIVVPGEVFDPRVMVAAVQRASKRFRLQTVALDPNNARQVEVEIVNDIGVDVYAFGQTAKKYNEPLRVLLDTVKDGRLVTGGDPLLYWAASNLVVRRGADGLMMPDKENSDDKIDPAVAFLMSFSESLYAGGKSKQAGYQNRGLRRIRGQA